MPYPFDDAGFTLWHGDVDTQLKFLLGVTSRDLGLDRRWLAERYYAGDSVAALVGRLDLNGSRPAGR